MIPIFNKDHLNKQRLQNINQSMIQVSYIQRECKKFLKLFQEKQVPILQTNERKNFQLLVSDKPEFTNLPDTRFELISLDPKGKYVLFPKDPFTIFWSPEHPFISGLDELKNSCYTGWVNDKLFEAKEQSASILLFTSKIYFIETSMFHALETKFLTMFLGTDQTK